MSTLDVVVGVKSLAYIGGLSQLKSYYEVKERIMLYVWHSRLYGRF